MTTEWFHGGKAGLNPGDLLVPSPPHVFDGCPICQARASGQVFTVLQMKVMLSRVRDPRAATALALIEGEPDDAPIDPPSEEQAVYVTTDREYATWYAGRSKGDLYQVVPQGDLRRSPTDHFPSFMADSARVVSVLRRGVRLTRSERRHLMRRWAKADRSFAEAMS